MYLALYRKYRPKTFGDILSQNHVTSTLRNEIKLKKIAHAYLFNGPKGTGKTSCAKIFSKAINCKNPIEGEPCCKCKICLAVEAESILDVTEMDGASNNSVNTIRNLRDEANFVPTVCKYRIYIIDEAHMLSTSAFNALLKIMEEPPKYVIFILATTEIYKLPETVISRCQRFNFGRIKIKDLKNGLTKVCSNENIDISEDALGKIAALSYGSMRDALSMLDKCSIGRNKINSEIVEDSLNIISRDYIFKLDETIKEKNICKAIKIVNSLYESGKDLEYLVLELLEFYHEMICYSVFGKNAKDIVEYNKYLDKFETRSCLKKEELISIEEEILNCYEKIKNSYNKKLQIEITLLNICRGKNNVNVDLNASRLPKQQLLEESNIKNIKLLFDETKKNDKSFKEFVDSSEIYVENKRINIKPLKEYPEEKILEYEKIIIDILKEKTKKAQGIFVESKKYNSSMFDKFLDVIKKNNINVDLEKG